MGWLDWQFVLAVAADLPWVVGAALTPALVGLTAFLGDAGEGGFSKLRLAFSAKFTEISPVLLADFGIKTVDPPLILIPLGIPLTSRNWATSTPKSLAACSGDTDLGINTAVHDANGF